MQEVIAELGFGDTVVICVVACVLLYGIIGPWVAQVDLKHLSGIESELRGIKSALREINEEIKKGRQDDG